MTHPISEEELAALEQAAVAWHGKDLFVAGTREQSEFVANSLAALPALIQAYRVAREENADLRQAVESANFAARHHYERLTANLDEYEKLQANISDAITEAKRAAGINAARRLACEFADRSNYDAAHVCEVHANEIEQGLDLNDEEFAIEQADLWRKAKAEAKREGAIEALEPLALEYEDYADSSTFDPEEQNVYSGEALNIRGRIAALRAEAK